MEAVKLENLLVRKFKIENLCILSDFVRACGFGDDDEPVLDCPAKQHLRVGAAVLLRNRCYARIVEPLACGQRGVCFDLY